MYLWFWFEGHRERLEEEVWCACIFAFFPIMFGEQAAFLLVEKGKICAHYFSFFFLPSLILATKSTHFEWEFFHHKKYSPKSLLALCQDIKASPSFSCVFGVLELCSCSLAPIRDLQCPLRGLLVSPLVWRNSLQLTPLQALRLA